MANIQFENPEQLDYLSPPVERRPSVTGNAFLAQFTPQDARIILKRSSKESHELVDFRIRPYTEGKIGFLSSHFCLVITSRSPSGIEVVTTYFVKAVPYDIPEQADYVEQKGLFLQEISYYSEIVPELEVGFTSEHWSPACYLTKNDLLVFEDLATRGYAMKTAPFDVNLVKSGLSCVARMHAASLLAEYRLNGKLNDLFPHAFRELSFGTDKKSIMWFQAGVDVVAAVGKRANRDSELLTSVCQRIFDAIKPSKTKSNVVSHADLWANNIMYSDDTPAKCMLIDFQMLRYSPLGHDVAQLLYLTTTSEFRKRHEKEMIEHYYSILKQVMLKNRPEIKVPELSEIVEGYEEQRLGAAISAAIFYPTILLDKKLGAAIMNNPDIYAQYYFHDRVGIVFDNMSKYPMYNHRITDIVNELSDLAEIIDSLPVPT